MPTLPPKPSEEYLNKRKNQGGCDLLACGGARRGDVVLVREEGGAKIDEFFGSELFGYFEKDEDYQKKARISLFDDPATEGIDEEGGDVPDTVQEAINIISIRR